jgi:Aldehyde dehydrogenase family
MRVGLTSIASRAMGQGPTTQVDRASRQLADSRRIDRVLSNSNARSGTSFRRQPRGTGAHSKEHVMAENGVTENSGIKEYKHFVAGEWRSAENVYRPYDRALYARVAACGRSEAKRAVEAAANAFPAWSQTAPAERAKLFFRAAEIVKRRRAEIAKILALETGSTISFATFQQDLVSPRSSKRQRRPGSRARCSASNAKEDAPILFGERI